MSDLLFFTSMPLLIIIITVLAISQVHSNISLCFSISLLSWLIILRTYLCVICPLCVLFGDMSLHVLPIFKLYCLGFLYSFRYIFSQYLSLIYGLPIDYLSLSFDPLNKIFAEQFLVHFYVIFSFFFILCFYFA